MIQSPLALSLVEGLGTNGELIRTYVTLSTPGFANYV